MKYEQRRWIIDVECNGEAIAEYAAKWKNKESLERRDLEQLRAYMRQLETDLKKLDEFLPPWD